MVSQVVDDNTSQDPLVDEQLQNTDGDDILKDLMKRSEILKKLGLPDPSVLTPSGKDTGGGGLLPQMWCPFPMFAPWNLAFGASMAGPHMEGSSQQQLAPSSGDTDLETGKDPKSVNEDLVGLLDNSEALEFVEFDPTVKAPLLGPRQR